MPSASPATRSLTARAATRSGLFGSEAGGRRPRSRTRVEGDSAAPVADDGGDAGGGLDGLAPWSRLFDADEDDGHLRAAGQLAVFHP